MTALAHVRKALAALAAFVGVAAAALSDGQVTAQEFGAIAAAGLGVLAVFGVRNGPAIADRTVDLVKWLSQHEEQLGNLERIVCHPTGAAVVEPADGVDLIGDDETATPDPDELELDDAPAIEVADDGDSAAPASRSNA